MHTDSSDSRDPKSKIDKITILNCRILFTELNLVPAMKSCEQDLGLRAHSSRSITVSAIERNLARNSKLKVKSREERYCDTQHFYQLSALGRQSKSVIMVRLLLRQTYVFTKTTLTLELSYVLCTCIQRKRRKYLMKIFFIDSIGY